jgi:hypothetical protein
MTFPPHAQPFQQRGRCRVPRVAVGGDPVLAAFGEQVGHQQAHGLGGVPVALMLSGDREPDIALAGIIGMRHGRAVSDLRKSVLDRC